MKTRLYVIIIAIACISITCKKETLYNPVDSDILVSVSSDEEGVYINAKTEKTYGCCNYSIIYKKSRNTTQFSIDFIGIDMPDVCLTALGAAMAKIKLGKLDPNDYTIDFSLNDIKTEANLSVGSNTTISIPIERNVRLN